MPFDHTTLKCCTACGESKPATTEYFARCTRNRDGLKERCKTCEALYREQNREDLRKKNRLYKLRSKEKIRESNRRYRSKNKEKVARWQKRYITKNKAKRAQYQRQHALTYRQQHRANEIRRRAHKRNSEGDHTAADVKHQYKNQRGKCYYCGQKVSKTYHVDHVIPLSRGGSNGPENIVIACPGCNQRKKDKLPHEWPEGGRLL